jgi:hypothetical protein
MSLLLSPSCSALPGDGWGEFHRWKWKLNFLRWTAGLTTDVRENASAHGDNYRRLKLLNLPEENVSDLRAAVFRQNAHDLSIYK